MSDDYFTSEIFPDKLNCFIVYSSDTHVTYILNFLYFISESLQEYNIKPVTINETVRAGEDYFTLVIKLIEQCEFGIVVFDGFRPNIILEMGILIGCKKEIIYFMGENAEINVKTLYDINSTTETTGLTNNAFEKRLMNPKIDVTKHLSDFGNRHVCCINLNNPKIAVDKINNEIQKILIIIQGSK